MSKRTAETCDSLNDAKLRTFSALDWKGRDTEAPTSPHLVLPGIPASDGPRLYFGDATNDRFMPQEAIDRLNAALVAWGGKHESEVYDGALHSWTVPDSPVYNQPQAERAFAKLTEIVCREVELAASAGDGTIAWLAHLRSALRSG
jgi:dienelactone hydrolase